MSGRRRRARGDRVREPRPHGCHENLDYGGVGHVTVLWHRGWRPPLRSVEVRSTAEPPGGLDLISAQRSSQKFGSYKRLRSRGPSAGGLSSTSPRCRVGVGGLTGRSRRVLQGAGSTALLRLMPAAWCGRAHHPLRLAWEAVAGAQVPSDQQEEKPQGRPPQHLRPGLWPRRQCLPCRHAVRDGDPRVFAANKVVGVGDEALGSVQSTHAHEPQRICECGMISEEQHAAVGAPPRSTSVGIDNHVALAPSWTEQLDLSCRIDGIDGERRPREPLTIAAMAAVDGLRSADNPIPQTAAAAASNESFIGSYWQNGVDHASGHV